LIQFFPLLDFSPAFGRFFLRSKRNFVVQSEKAAAVPKEQSVVEKCSKGLATTELTG
jgi:hypothetical protein